MFFYGANKKCSLLFCDESHIPKNQTLYSDILFFGCHLCNTQSLFSLDVSYSNNQSYRQHLFRVIPTASSTDLFALYLSNFQAHLALEETNN